MIYRLDLTANSALTAHAGEFVAAPAALRGKFGLPLLNDGDSESLGTYVFVGPAGEVLTVYYRANDVPRERIESLQQQFWRSSNLYAFSVGARKREHAAAFLEWLKRQVATQ